MERGSVIDAQLDNPRYVQSKHNNTIRFVTNLIPSTEDFRFEDDGIVSGVKPSDNCYIENYYIDVLKIDPRVVVKLHLYRRKLERQGY